MLSMVATLLIGQTASGYNLTPQYKKGDAWECTLRLTGEDDSGRYEIESLLKQKVTDRTSAGFTITSTTSSTLIRFAGQEIKDAREQKTLIKHDLGGKVIDVQSNEGKSDAMLAAALTRYVGPGKSVKVDESWQVNYAGDKNSPNLRLTYHLEKVEDNVATVGVTISDDNRERPYRGRGTWLIDTASGQWKSYEAEITNFGGSTKSPARISITRR